MEPIQIIEVQAISSEIGWSQMKRKNKRKLPEEEKKI